MARVTALSLLLVLLFCGSHSHATETIPPLENQCREIIENLNAQKAEVQSELRLIKREITAMKATLDEPGFTEIIGGLGYILGIFGTGYYIYARSMLKAKE